MGGGVTNRLPSLERTAFLESGTLTPFPAHYLLEMGLKEGGVSEMVVKGGGGFWRRDGVIPRGGGPAAGRRRTP